MSTATLPPPKTGIDSEALTEVVNGEVVEKNMSAGTTRLASRLAQNMGPFAQANRLGFVDGEMLFVLDVATDLRRRPDVAFVSSQRWPLDRDPPAKGDWEIAPDLAIEVVSPNETYRDVVGKVWEYFEYGVRQVWVVEPDKSCIYIYDSPTDVRIVAAPAQIETSLLPGWKMSLAELFRTDLIGQSRP